MSNVERNLARGPKPGDARLEAMLRGIDSLSTPAFLAARLMELYAGGAGSAEEMLRVARLDPALTAKLLANSEQTCSRNNNSAEAWHPWQPEAVRSAVPAMQTDCVPQELRAEFEALWRHSVAAALAAERIARELNSPGVDRREAYVCGLLHDLGKFAAWQAMPKSYAGGAGSGAIGCGNRAGRAPDAGPGSRGYRSAAGGVVAAAAAGGGDDLAAPSSLGRPAGGGGQDTRSRGGAGQRAGARDHSRGRKSRPLRDVVRGTRRPAWTGGGGGGADWQRVAGSRSLAMCGIGNATGRR